jgi:hypothetical protein
MRRREFEIKTERGNFVGIAGPQIPGRSLGPLTWTGPQDWNVFFVRFR